MTLGKVVGTVVATRKDEKLIGSKLMIVQDSDPVSGELERKYTVAVDAVGAGVGEMVLIATGSSARQTEMTKDKPVDAVIMAIVDIVEVHGEIRFQK
jgi:microcompartment protein CcmK/EutM